MSIAGGFEHAIMRGESIGCTCIQIFTKSNRQWHANKITKEQATLFQQTVKQSSISIDHIVAHASYLINIGSSNTDIRKKSIAALLEELERCNVLTVPYLILHPGSSVGALQEDTINNIINALNETFDTFTGKTKLLLETMSGQGSTVCYNLEQIAQVLKGSKHKSHLGVCVDACHIFAAGYDVSHEQGYKDFWSQFDAIIGLNKLHAIHINDSKGKLGSKIDRHADVGKGELGLTFFKLLFNDKRFFDIPKILETPESHNIMDDYVRNMDVIKGLISDENKKLLGIE
jgi:deoxyribonuclease-4